MSGLDPQTHTDSRRRTSHVMQLFDSDESLADAVADFCSERLLRDETTLAIMGEERWFAVATRLSTRGFAVGDALFRGQLTVRSAERMLKGIMRGGRPHLSLISTSVGPLISRLVSFGRPLGIYGEMVDLLASRGEHAAARELEELWNILGSRHDYKLLCGYKSEHFADPSSGDELRRICAAHSEVRSDPRDVVGSSLVRP